MSRDINNGVPKGSTHRPPEMAGWRNRLAASDAWKRSFCFLGTPFGGKEGMGKQKGRKKKNRAKRESKSLCGEGRLINIKVSKKGNKIARVRKAVRKRTKNE